MQWKTTRLGQYNPLKEWMTLGKGQSSKVTAAPSGLVSMTTRQRKTLRRAVLLN
jgi:hypothetical protein